MCVSLSLCLCHCEVVGVPLPPTVQKHAKMLAAGVSAMDWQSVLAPIDSGIRSRTHDPASHKMENGWMGNK